MELTYLLRGGILGFSVAAIVGPIALLCIQRTLQRGFWYGLVSGMGAATADATYGSIAAFGLTIITTMLTSVQYWLRLVGGLFLLYLGIRSLFSVFPTHAASTPLKSKDYITSYLSTFVLTMSNPQTILLFLAMFASLGTTAAASPILAAILVVTGVFLGSALWWVILSGGIELLRERITPRWLQWLSRGASVIVLIFALITLWGLIVQ